MLVHEFLEELSEDKLEKTSESLLELKASGTVTFNRPWNRLVKAKD